MTSEISWQDTMTREISRREFISRRERYGENVIMAGYYDERYIMPKEIYHDGSDIMAGYYGERDIMAKEIYNGETDIRTRDISWQDIMAREISRQYKDITAREISEEMS